MTATRWPSISLLYVTGRLFFEMPIGFIILQVENALAMTAGE